MSEDVKIHYVDRAVNRVACGETPVVGVWQNGSCSWPEVTCPACKLEQPMQKPAESPEYRSPESVREVDALLAEVDRRGVKPAGASLAELRYVVRTAQLLDQAKACRDHALSTMEHWQAEWSKAQSLVGRLETTLSASLAGESASVVGPVGVEASGGSQTDVEALSAEAQSALIEAENGRVRAGTAAAWELLHRALVFSTRDLTPKGEAARALLINRRLDAAFGGPLA